MKNYHLFYQNFVSLIENRPKSVGWHWRGEATIKSPEKLKNCPLPLQKIFRHIHHQLLQWHANPLYEYGEENSISGEMYLLDVNTFDHPIQEISISILGKNGIGKLYDWVENGVFEEIDYQGVGVYIFVDNDDKNFCHLILKNDQYYIPTAFDINDFLLLLAHTRGLQGLYACLGRGIEGRFLNDLLTLKETFENVDIDFCIQKLYQQHIQFNSKVSISQNSEIQIFVKDTNLKLLLNTQIVEIETSTYSILTLIQELYKSLIYIENSYSDDFFDNRFEAWESYTIISHKNMIFSISHTEKHLLVIEKINLEDLENNFSDFCDAISFYTALLTSVNKFKESEIDIIPEKSFAWSTKKLQTLLQFLYVGYFL